MEDDNLVNLTTQIIAYCQKERLDGFSSEEWLRLHYLFYIQIDKSSAISITNALELDENLVLPFYITCDLHQKRVFLEDCNPIYMLEFARFLRLNSNSWMYLADYFEKTALKARSFD